MISAAAPVPDTINVNILPQEQTLKAEQGSHLSKDLRESLKWSRNLSLSAPDLRSDYEGQEVPFKLFFPRSLQVCEEKVEVDNTDQDIIVVQGYISKIKNKKNYGRKDK